MGKTGITYDSLSKLSLEDMIKINEGKTNEMKEHWEMTRDIAFWTVKGWAKKKSLKKTDIMLFPWEKKQEISEEKITQIRANASKLRELIKSGKVKFKA